MDPNYDPNLQADLMSLRESSSIRMRPSEKPELLASLNPQATEEQQAAQFLSKFLDKLHVPIPALFTAISYPKFTEARQECANDILKALEADPSLYFDLKPQSHQILNTIVQHAIKLLSHEFHDMLYTVVQPLHEALAAACHGLLLGGVDPRSEVAAHVRRSIVQHHIVGRGFTAMSALEYIWFTHPHLYEETAPTDDTFSAGFKPYLEAVQHDLSQDIQGQCDVNMDLGSGGASGTSSQNAMLDEWLNTSIGGTAHAIRTASQSQGRSTLKVSQGQSQSQDRDTLRSTLKVSQDQDHSRSGYIMRAAAAKPRHSLGQQGGSDQRSGYYGYVSADPRERLGRTSAEDRHRQSLGQPPKAAAGGALPFPQLSAQEKAGAQAVLFGESAVPPGLQGLVNAPQFPRTPYSDPLPPRPQQPGVQTRRQARAGGAPAF